MISFKNKNILITGASGGIGNALVKKFVARGGNAARMSLRVEQVANAEAENSETIEFRENILKATQDLKECKCFRLYSQPFRFRFDKLYI